MHSKDTHKVLLVLQIKFLSRSLNGIVIAACYNREGAIYGEKWLRSIKAIMRAAVLLAIG